jgi:hypothetical protein
MSVLKSIVDWMVDRLSPDLSADEVAARLDALAAAREDDVTNWRKSVVDLMKLAGLESSLEERRALAVDLGYDRDTNDTATMNVWLHREVFRTIAERGIRLPEPACD